MAEHSFSRRYFFFGSLLAGAVPIGGFGSTPSLPRVGYKSPNEKLNIASIGAGGKAADGINHFAALGENIVALCDPDDARATPMFRVHDKAPKYKDFRQMLDKEDRNIDAVQVATPDFMHGTQAMWAMERGKHVYVQKPLTRTVWESRQLREAALKYKVATQMGNQGYCEEGPRVCSEMIWSGAIGNVTEVHAWTNRPIWAQGLTEIPAEEPVPPTLDWDNWLGIAKARPFSTRYVPFQWRGWYDFGCGALGDMACHVLGAPNMALLLGAPTSVECIRKDSKSPYYYPMKSSIRLDFPARKNMPALKLFWHDGARGLPEEYWPAAIPKDEKLGDLPSRPNNNAGGRSHAANVRRAPAIAPAPDPTAAALSARIAPYNTPPSSGALYIGDKGYMTTGEYGAAPRLLPSAKMEDYQYPAPLLVRHPETFTDWVRACKGGDPGASNFEIAAPFTEWIAMACIALRVEGRLDWDAARMQFTNNRLANEYLRPTFRKGWSFT